MSIIDTIIGTLAPYDCLRCGYEGALVCEKCARLALPSASERCYRCHSVSPGFMTCQACRGASQLRAVRVATAYTGLAKDLVWQFKFQGAQAAAREMARCFPAAGYESSHQPLVVPVPTATSRVRRRGYDQAKLLARAFARRHNLRYADCLRRSGQSHQVGASRQQRLSQLSEAFRVTAPGAARGQTILLVDDIVTTGATLEAAAAVLRQAGARSVEAAVFAQP